MPSHSSPEVGVSEAIDPDATEPRGHEAVDKGARREPVARRSPVLRAVLDRAIAPPSPVWRQHNHAARLVDHVDGRSVSGNSMYGNW